MMLPGFPRPIPSSAARTLDDYLEHVAAVSSAITVSGTAQLLAAFGSSTDVNFQFPGTTLSGSMYGSPWGKSATSDSIVIRFLQHCVPTLSELESQQTNSGRVMMKLERITEGSRSAVNRNSYLSLSYASSYPGYRCLEFVYWDFAQGAAFKMEPLAMVGPAPYQF